MNFQAVTLNRLKIAMLNFVIVAFLGCLLRYYFYSPFTGFIYPYTLHAHSHLAFLGWVFMALYALLLEAFLPEEQISSKRYSIFFLVLQVANMGMLFTFPFTGYALWSIVFSTVHSVISIVFAILFIKTGSRYLKPGLKIPFMFVKWALILMIISNLGPFALGPIMAKGLGQTDIYYIVIYFYLHFQYNGWFTFAVIGLLLVFLQQQRVNIEVREISVSLRLKLIAIFPAFILSTLWLKDGLVWNISGGIGGAIQLAGVSFLMAVVIKDKALVFRKIPGVAKLLLSSGLIAMVAQHLLQFLSSFPVLGQFAFQQRNVIISYLHLVLIGFVTSLILFYMIYWGFFKASRLVSIGFVLFLVSFLLTEGVLLFQSQISNSSAYLFVLAAVQFGSLLLLLFNMESSKKFLNKKSKIWDLL